MQVGWVLAPRAERRSTRTGETLADHLLKSTDIECIDASVVHTTAFYRSDILIGFQIEVTVTFADKIGSAERDSLLELVGEPISKPLMRDLSGQ